MKMEQWGIKKELMQRLDEEISSALELEDTVRLDILITRTAGNGEAYEHQISVYEGEKTYRD